MESEISPRVHLKTKAVSEDRNGKKYEHDVYLRFDERGIVEFSAILVIDGTPGQWYLSTLLEDFADSLKSDGFDGSYLTFGSIAIDGGQRWIWTNVNDVMREVFKSL